MPTPNNLNSKAFQQLILYYLQERKAGNLEIKHLIITDAYQWFIFEEKEFEKLFYQNNSLKNQFEAWEQSGKTTDVFYTEVAEPFLKGTSQRIKGLYLNLKNEVSFSQKDTEVAKRRLMSLYKMFSVNHLLREYSYDSNQLDKKFYDELLYIIGLEETKEGGKKIIQRVTDSKRQQGSLLENTIDALEDKSVLSKLENPLKYGKDRKTQYFNIGLELVIGWVKPYIVFKAFGGSIVSFS